MNEVNNSEKISFTAIIFAISTSFIFVAVEGSFLIRSIIPLIMLLMLYNFFKNKKLIVTSSIKCFIVLELIYLLATYMTSFFYKVDTSVFIQLIYQLLIFLWFFSVFQQERFNKKEISIYMNVYIICATIASIYLLIHSLILKTYGLFSLINLFGVKINKNFFGAYISLAPIFSLLKYLYCNKNKLLWLLLTGVVLFASFFTNSRATLIITAIGIFLIFLRYFGKNINIKNIFILMLFAVIILIGINLILKVLPEWMYNRYFVRSYKDDSNIQRVALWNNALNELKKSPLLGFGLGTFQSISEYQRTLIGSDATYAHNTYIDFMVNGGFIGLILNIGIIVFTIKDAVFKCKLFRPVAITLLLTIGILGAGKSVYYWNGVIFLGMLSNYAKSQQKDIDILNSEETI